MKKKPFEISGVIQPQSKHSSLTKILDELKRISEIKKCSFCGCNENALREFGKLASARNKTELAAKALGLELEIADRKKYECKGCNPCFAAEVSNRLFEISNEHTTGNKVSFRVPESYLRNSPTAQNKWPVERGDYLIGNQQASVAINTLSNTDLPAKLIKTLKEKIAITGFCETENIGVEKVVKNIISNPNIRTLIICGDESGQNSMDGHFSGQALLSLHANGINGEQRIISAKGKRPFVKNLTREEVERFQSQVEMINLIGNNSIDDISQQVDVASSKEKKAFVGVEILKRSNENIIAQNPQKLRLDKSGYFVIIPDKSENKIFVEHYANTGEFLHTIVGNDASSIYYTIIEKGFISKLDHCAYLGKELTKAEYFLKYDFPYKQGKALGELTEE